MINWVIGFFQTILTCRHKDLGLFMFFCHFQLFLEHLDYQFIRGGKSYSKLDIYLETLTLAVENREWTHISGLWFVVFQYFSNIVAVSFIGGGNHWPVASNWLTLSYNVVLSTPRHDRVRTHNFSGDRNCLHSHKSKYHTITTTITWCWTLRNVTSSQDIEWFLQHQVFSFFIMSPLGNHTFYLL